MADTTTAATGLPISLTAAAAEKLGSLQSGTVNFGPLKISWNLDISIPQITVDATLYGTSIGHVVLNKQHPTGTIGGNIGIAKAEVDLTADFTKKELDYAVDVEVLGHPIAKKSGRLFSW